MWLLESSVRNDIEQATKAGFMPTAEQQEIFAMSHLATPDNSRILTMDGGTAIISVKGTLTKAPSFMAMFFGGGNTTYAEIAGALAEAEQNNNVESITLSIDSPGGHFDGLFDALAAIQSSSKPVTASVSNLCASAAFAIASQADSIVANNHAARIGSIGVAATFEVYDNEVTITSTAAPKKRPDVSTDEGVAMVREELDALHSIFVEAIATGRDSTVLEINSNFGQGATLLARDALKRGMIDSIASTSLKTVNSTNVATGDNTTEIIMDRLELQAKHPEAYAEAVAHGETQERDRSTAHLTMGEASGDMKTAITAIKEGSQMTATLQSQYMAAGMNRKDTANRQDDDNDAGDGAEAGDGAGDGADSVASLVETKLGIGEV